jgi:hypothetical protein
MALVLHENAQNGCAGPTGVVRTEACSDRAGFVVSPGTGQMAWAASATSLVWVVDQWTGFDADADPKDRVHPNMQGAQKMAVRRADALRAHGVL